MGESACWLHLTCRECGSVSDRIDRGGLCPSCRAATAVDAGAGTAERSDGPAAAPAATDTDTTPTTNPTHSTETTEGDPTDV